MKGAGPGEDIDYRAYYDLESYLFETVNRTFRQEGHISVSDFFCIIIWKANRAKSRVARSLLSRGYADLGSAVRTLTAGIAQQATARDKLRYLRDDWGFRLPIASAILSVCYPEEFTVYDVRVGAALGFEGLINVVDFDRLWEGYERFVKAVVTGAPSAMTLRDKDRYLWGKSFYEQLLRDIEGSFGYRNDGSLSHDPFI